MIINERIFARGSMAEKLRQHSVSLGCTFHQIFFNHEFNKVIAEGQKPSGEWVAFDPNILLTPEEIAILLQQNRVEIS